MTEIRLHNLRRIVSRYETHQAVASEAGLSGQYLNQLLSGHRNIGEKTARKIERALRLTPGELDRDGTEVAAGLRADQMQLLQSYNQLSPKYQELLRETAAGFAKLERMQQQQQ